jgi:hypothetical protein
MMGFCLAFWSIVVQSMFHELVKLCPTLDFTLGTPSSTEVVKFRSLCKS